MRTLIHIHAHSYTCMHTLIHIHTLRYIHLPSYTLTCVHMHVHTVMYRHTYANIINFKMKMVKNNPCRMTESINEHAHTEHTHAQHTRTARMHSTHAEHSEHTCIAHMHSIHAQCTHRVHTYSTQSTHATHLEHSMSASSYQSNDFTSATPPSPLGITSGVTGSEQRGAVGPHSVPASSLRTNGSDQH